MNERFVPLWCKSNYSFLEGASHPEELVEQAAAYGYPALGLADVTSFAGVVEALQAAERTGLRLLVGAQVPLEEGGFLVLLAAEAKGYENLSHLLTQGHLAGLPTEQPPEEPRFQASRRRFRPGRQRTFRLGLTRLLEAAQGLVVLWGGHLFARPEAFSPERELAMLRRLAEAFPGRLYGLVARHFRTTDPLAERAVRDLAGRLGIPLVAAPEVLYHTLARRRLQDLLTAVRLGRSLDEARGRLRPNDSFVLPGPQAVHRIYRDLPEAVENTMRILDQCSFGLRELHYSYPVEEGPRGEPADAWLRELVRRGALARYQGRVPEPVRRQLRRELDLIAELGYAGYFLTMHEIVQFCRKRGILCQGRGSAANSAVCYCLGITAVDPVRSNLLFERFLSRERNEPPDIDLDIAHQRREEVIQHVFQRYPGLRAAMVASTIRYRPRSSIRDVGRALGLPQPLLEHLASLTSHRELPDEQALRQAGLSPDSRAARLLLDLSRELLGFPRHLATHPGGFLLSAEPIWRLVPIQPAATEGRLVVQWDKYDIEEMGFFKVDLLGLGALTLLDEAFRLVRRHHGIQLDMASIPPDDPDTFDMLCAADTVGVFQVESRAQMAMLPRLRPRCYYDLVIEISLVRPGPIAGQMVHPYLRRRSGVEPVTYPHPSLEPILARTLGVPLFQEQVMKLAMAVADYSPGEADQLRRDMAAWRRKGSMERHRRRLLERMTAKGIAPEFALQIYEQIAGFGEYGFPESHAASFALITYASAYLKRHFPAAFTCALLNAQPMGFYSPASIVQDARRHGVEIRRISVNASQWPCTLEPSARGPAVRMGLRFVKGLSEKAARRLVAERERRGPFASIEDCAERCGLDRAQLEHLATAGAFEDLEPNRRQALWRATGWDPAEGPFGRPGPDPARFEAPGLPECITWDHESSGHSPDGHLLAPLRPEFQRHGLPEAALVGRMAHGSPVRYAGLVICRQRPSTAKGVVFLTLEDETGLVNVVIMPDIYERYRLLVRSRQLLGLDGRIQREGTSVTVLAERFWTPRLDTRPRLPSRDFR